MSAESPGDVSTAVEEQLPPGWRRVDLTAIPIDQTGVHAVTGATRTVELGDDESAPPSR